MRLTINPGTGPVEGATLENAHKSLIVLVGDCELPFQVESKRFEKKDKSGRFCFKLEGNGKSALVEMPGLPLEQVRFTGENGQSPWDYPRLYVDGSSWLWKYAVSIVTDHLIGEDDDNNYLEDMEQALGWPDKE